MKPPDATCSYHGGAGITGSGQVGKRSINVKLSKIQLSKRGIKKKRQRARDLQASCGWLLRYRERSQLPPVYLLYLPARERINGVLARRVGSSRCTNPSNASYAVYEARSARTRTPEPGLAHTCKCKRRLLMACRARRSLHFKVPLSGGPGWWSFLGLSVS